MVLLLWLLLSALVLFIIFFHYHNTPSYPVIDTECTLLIAIMRLQKIRDVERGWSCWFKQTPSYERWSHTVDINIDIEKDMRIVGARVRWAHTTSHRWVKSHIAKDKGGLARTVIGTTPLPPVAVARHGFDPVRRVDTKPGWTNALTTKFSSERLGN